jgi:hypothetical protein
MGMATKPEEKRPVEDFGLDGRIILKKVLKKSLGRAWTGLICLRLRTSGIL